MIQKMYPVLRDQTGLHNTPCQCQKETLKNGEPAVDLSFTTMLQHTGRFWVKDFLAKNNVITLYHPPHSSDLAAPYFTCYLDWTQHCRDGAFVMLLTSLRMRRKSWKGFHKMGFSAPLHSLVEIYGCTRGLFGEKYSSNVCTVLYYHSDSGNIFKLPHTVLQI
jgi:hypothetical protein